MLLFQRHRLPNKLNFSDMTTGKIVPAFSAMLTCWKSFVCYYTWACSLPEWPSVLGNQSGVSQGAAQWPGRSLCTLNSAKVNMPSSGYKNTKRGLEGDKFIRVEINIRLLGGLCPPHVVSRESEQQPSEVETVQYISFTVPPDVRPHHEALFPISILRLTELWSWLMVGL